ncbi:hypothetical protein AKJ16_DCAP26335 [Drosera capensis]
MEMKLLRFVLVFLLLCSSMESGEGQVVTASTIHSIVLRQLTQGVNETERTMQLGSHGHDEEEAKLNKGIWTSRETEDHEHKIHFHSKKGGTHGKPPSGGGFGGGLLGHHHSSSYYKRQRNHAGRADLRVFTNKGN